MHSNFCIQKGIVVISQTEQQEQPAHSLEGNIYQGEEPRRSQEMNSTLPFFLKSFTFGTEWSLAPFLQYVLQEAAQARAQAARTLCLVGARGLPILPWWRPRIPLSHAPGFFLLPLPNSSFAVDKHVSHRSNLECCHQPINSSNCASLSM